MSPSKTIGRRRQRFGSAPAWLAGLMALALVAGCSSSVDVSFRLVPPCPPDKQTLLSGANCGFIRVIISALDPGDPLCPTCDPGPLAKICDLGETHCKIAGDELLGAGRVVDVLCLPTPDAAPVARGTSNALLFDDTSDGAAGLKASLLMGEINTFAETTIVDPKHPDFATCSLLAESSGRFGHAAVTLADGRVLITGGIKRYGQGVEEILATAEIYDPTTGEHRLLLQPDGQALKMRASSGRAFHTMTLLRPTGDQDQGLVLITGGVGMLENKRQALRSAELFDPNTETFINPMDMVTARAHHQATMLSTGTVLITGGATYSDNGQINAYLDSAQIFDPVTRTWSNVGNTMSTPRAFHQAVLLDPAATQGKVLVVGGQNSNGTLNSADIFNPNGVQFYTGVDVAMSRNRSRFCAVRLTSGRVMVAGGTTLADDPATGDLEYTPDSGVEIYDPTDGSFGSFTPDVINLASARMDHTCHLLEDGSVLVAGGLSGGNQATGLGELVRDMGGTYEVSQLPEPMEPERYLHASVSLRNKWVLFIGGLRGTAVENQAIRQSLLFVPMPLFQ